MALLSEYAITPDVFDISSYVHEEVGTARFEYIKDVFLEEALLRNLRDGEWIGLFSTRGRLWHRRGIELLKKITKQNRLRLAVAAYPKTPASDSEWCREALASHQIDPLIGIIVTANVVDEIGANPSLGRIDRLGSSPCWTCRSQSTRVRRNLLGYEAQLRLIMRAANSVMFIDPHIDPTLRRYGDFLPLLQLAQDRCPTPAIEIHRVIYVGSGHNRQIINVAEWESRFRDSWTAGLTASGLKVEIFIWDHHHDRYLITDLLGIEIGNGFDTTADEGDITTWTRISRKDRDDIQREFDPNCNRHSLISRFSIP